MSKCPIPGCGTNARPGQLLCPSHWRAVPSAGKRRVWTAWRAIRHRDGQTREQILDGIAEYRSARAAAINAVATAESPLCD